MGSRLTRSGGDAVALVLVGDELLLGHVVDTNAAWWGRRLHDAGLRVVRAVRVPDDIAAVADAVRWAATLAPTVLLSGGLGPTSDDVTREALAAAAGVDLVRDPAAVAMVEGTYRLRGRGAPPEPALHMADLPTGARALPNRVGVAPGIVVRVGDALVVALPGVPRELMGMTDDALLPLLAASAADGLASAVAGWRVAVVGEGEVAGRLQELEAELEADDDAEIAYLAVPGEVTIRITVSRASATEAQSTVARYATQAQAALGDAVLGDLQTSPAAALLDALGARSWTLATAESLTGGLVAAALTDVPGASRVLRGGVVAYATELKHRLIGVPDDVLARHGAVSAATADAMARGVARATGARVGVATTGVAGPDDQEGHPPGTVFVAVHTPSGARVRALQLFGDRGVVREQSVAHVLDLARRVVLGRPEPASAVGLRGIDDDR